MIEAVLRRRTPCFRKQLAHGGRLEFGEEGAAVHTAKVTDVALPIQFLGDDREARRLLEVEPARRDEIARSEKIRHFGTDIKVYLLQHLCDIRVY